MKMIFVVVVNKIHGKYYAIADTIKTGENLISILNRYNTNICHLCENRKDAERIATEWNNHYKQNGTSIFI